MHMGGLAIIGTRGPRNLKHVVINNGAHDSVGGQPTAARHIDLSAVARACGYAATELVDGLTGLGEAVARLRQADGPAMLEVRVASRARTDAGRPTIVTGREQGRVHGGAPRMRRAWEHHNPTRVVFGPGVVRELEGVVGDRVLVLCSPGAVERGLAARVAALIGERRVRIHAHVAVNPAVAALDESIAELRELPIDVVVALGGGSAIDTGKVLSASLARRLRRPRASRARGTRRRALAHVPLVAVPTTAGTGSEVTPFATVWDPTEPRKLSVASPSLFPTIALVDPELALGLDWEQTLSTGLDAFVQCFEAIWNRNATPVTSAVAERGLTLVPDALRHLKREPHAVSARADLAEAALLSGLAISQTRTALAHSLSYPITAHFGVPHGLACALVLPAVLEFNLEADDGRLARVARPARARAHRAPPRARARAVPRARRRPRRPPARRPTWSARGARARDAHAGPGRQQPSARRRRGRAWRSCAATHELLGVEVAGREHARASCRSGGR